MFVRTDEYSYFPFAFWIFFPTAGYLFSRMMKQADIKARLYQISAAVSAGILALTTVIGLYFGYNNCMLNTLDSSEFEYYVPNFISQLWGSTNIIPIYVVQWGIIALMTPVLKLSLNIFFTYIACAVITAMTFGTTKLYLDLKEKLRKSRHD